MFFTDPDARFAASLRTPKTEPRAQRVAKQRQRDTPVDDGVAKQLASLQEQQMGMLQALDQFSRKVSSVLQTLSDR